MEARHLKFGGAAVGAVLLTAASWAFGEIQSLRAASVEARAKMEKIEDLRLAVKEMKQETRQDLKDLREEIAKLVAVAANARGR